MGQRILGQKDPIVWTCGPLVAILLVGGMLCAVLAWINWPR